DAERAANRHSDIAISTSDFIPARDRVRLAFGSSLTRRSLANLHSAAPIAETAMAAGVEPTPCFVAQRLSSPTEAAKERLAVSCPRPSGAGDVWSFASCDCPATNAGRFAVAGRIALGATARAIAHPPPRRACGSSRQPRRDYPLAQSSRLDRSLLPAA